MRLSFVFRRRLRHEIVHARFGGNGGGGQRIVAGDHHGADAHFAKLREPFLDAAFDDVFELDHAENFAAIRDDKRRAAGTRNIFDDAIHGFGKLPAEPVNMNLAWTPPRLCGWSVRADCRSPENPRRSCAFAR